MRLGEESLGVAHKQNLAILLNTIDLTPSAHDPSIVARDHDNEVDALGLQLVEVLEVGRDVEGLAARGESAGDGNDDDLLAGELLAGVVLLRHAAGGWVGVGDGCPSWE